MYQKLLVPLDGSELAECVLPHVEVIARGCETKNLVLFRVVEPVVIPPGADGPAFTHEETSRMDERHLSEARDYLESLASREKFRGLNISTEVVLGRVAESICDYAENNGVDFIAIATHGRSGVSRWVWGSVADRILRSSSVPVLMVRSPGCQPRTQT
ncbi:MAG: universal stress protein [Chloroflexi bacterium]|nr:universal stress protein [Chloroflexota bacterium]